MCFYGVKYIIDIFFYGNREGKIENVKVNEFIE